MKWKYLGFLIFSTIIFLIPIVISSNVNIREGLCLSNETFLFSVFQPNDTHISSSSNFFNYSVCYPAIRTINLSGDSCSSGENIILSLYQPNNTHVSAVEGYFNYSLCSPDITCIYKTSCLTGIAIGSLYQQNDSHWASSSTYFNNILCCEEPTETGTGVGGGLEYTTTQELKVDLEISLKPHYYLEKEKILIYHNETKFDGIALEVIGKNLNGNEKILDIEIVDASPQIFKDALPKNITESLRILQQKTLWTSDLMNINDFFEGNITFWIEVKGISEYSERLSYSKGHLNINLDAPEKNAGLFYSLGNKIWEGKPIAGLFALATLVIIGGFYFWKYKGTKKFNKWKDQSERRRIERKKIQEGWQNDI